MSLYFLFLLITGGISAAIIQASGFPGCVRNGGCSAAHPVLHDERQRAGRSGGHGFHPPFLQGLLFPDLADRCHRTTDPVPDTAGERPELGIYTAVFHLDIFWFLFCTVL